MTPDVPVIRTRAPIEGGEVDWEMATPPVPCALSPYVRSWLGYSERTPGPRRRRELPGAAVIVIIEIGPPIRVFERGGDGVSGHYPGGFVAGLDDTFSYTEHLGHQSGIQIALTPLGARTILGVPAHLLTRRVVGLTDLVPRRDAFLAERLAAVDSWSERFQILVAFLLGRLRSSDAPCPRVEWAIGRIEATSGDLDVGRLSTQLGMSRKHLIALFHAHVGFTPKRYARLVRFERLIEAVKARPDTPWTDLALELGYADQSHLVREVKQFSGVTPTRLRGLLAGWPDLPA